jgi:hypothetical protein
MFRRSTPVTVPALPVDTTDPHDICLKCGRATPVGVSLCEFDNPGRIKSPSTTQVHGTIVIGVIVGFVSLLLLLRFGSAGIGPFNSTLLGYTTRADGGLEVALSVSNGGTKPAGASCRISAKGALDPRDYFFFTDPIQPGETRRFTQVVPPPPDTAVVSPANVVVNCS